MECEKFWERYIGSTIRQLKHRLADHKSYITNQVTSRALRAHWNLPGHSLAQLKITILEQVIYKEEDYCREREKYLIWKFDTVNHGINREWGGNGGVLGNNSPCETHVNKPRNQLPGRDMNR